MRTFDTSSRIAAARSFLPALAALLAGCHREPAPPTPGSASASSAAEPAPPRATKLAGAPAHVLKVRFAPDGASVLVQEERRKQGDDVRGVGAYAISRRPVDGGPAVDVFAPAEMVLAMAPLGDGVVARTRPLALEETGETPPEGEGWEERRARDNDNTAKMAVLRIAGGAAPERLSREGLHCTSLVGAAGGQWVAYSLVNNGEPPFDGEIHVLGAQPGQDVKLDYRSLVYDISPDGARLLVMRRPGKDDAKKPPKDHRRDGAGGRVIVSVKDQTVTDLPEKIRVDGAEVDTASMLVGFAGDGLELVANKGDARYRSALDGSGATRIAEPKRDADAGAPDAGAGGDAGAPAKERRWISPKGLLYELREDESGAVVLSRGARPEALAPVTRFEGPLTGIVTVELDAEEKRAVLVVLSDTSRDGQLDSAHDDAEVFVADLSAPAAAPLGFGRAKVTPLADDIRPKIAAAAGVPEASVTVVSESGDVKATATLPWVDGEDGRTLLARMFTAARAIDAALPHRKFSLHLRAGEIDLTVYAGSREQIPHHLLIGNRGIIAADSAVLTLVHKDPRGLTGRSVETLTGELENSGKDPTPPIEVYSVRMEGPEKARKRVEVKKELGVIPPGKSARYSITVNTESFFGDDSAHATFRAEGKRLAVFNTYAYDHAVDALTLAIEAHTRLGVWLEHRELHYGGLRFIARLTAEQAALDDRAREALFKSVSKLLIDHRKKFHHDTGDRIAFAAPGGGGWIAELAKKTTRFEGDAEAALKFSFER